MPSRLEQLMAPLKREGFIRYDLFMNEHKISEYRADGMTEELAAPVAELLFAVWPESTKTLEIRRQQILEPPSSYRTDPATIRRFVIWEDGRSLAHALTFVREIRTDDGPLSVLALAGVCTDPQVRGKGLGAEITRECFRQVGQAGWPTLSLFQTPVPAFYEKLDSRLVPNRFVDRTAEDPEANPWRDKYVMIYPGGHQWPDGVIDLNGPDY